MLAFICPALTVGTVTALVKVALVPAYVVVALPTVLAFICPALSVLLVAVATVMVEAVMLVLTTKLERFP